MPKAPEKDLETDTEAELPPTPEASGNEIWVTVTKFGAGQVSTGAHIPGEGDIYAERGEKLLVSPKVADSLEARGLAERD